MNDENLVTVEAYEPERKAIGISPGWLLDAPHHVILIQETIETADLYSYAVIPKNLVRHISKLRNK